MTDADPKLPVTIRNEFAMVEVSTVSSPSGPMLKLEDPIRGASVTLDAVELEGLCWLEPRERQRLLDVRSRLTDQLPEDQQATEE